MKNVICVDFTKLDTDQLMVFCDDFGFDFDVMLDLKKKTYWKIWFLKCGTGIAYNLCQQNIFGIKDFEKVRYFSGLVDDFSAMDSYEPAPVVKTYDVDAILEKIGKYGKDSITKDEKDFLDNL